MNSLPVEILQQIFELACIDDGATGNSLSSTSKHIRAVARRARFHTLHVVVNPNGHTFQNFVAFFERECNNGRNPSESERPRVCHLYMTLLDSFPGPRAILQALENPLPSPAPRDSAQRSPAPPREHHRSLEHAVQDLVRLVAPDLRTLVVHVPLDGLRSRCPILEYTFPLLREATFIGSPTDPGRLLGPDADLSRVIFPSATHLHLIPGCGPDLHLSSWSILAPRVTHLRVSDLQHRHHITELAAAIGVSESPETLSVAQPHPPQPSPRTYPSVRYLLMDVSARLTPWESADDSWRRAREAIMRRLDDIIRECGRADADVRAALLRAPNYVTYMQLSKALLDQWLEQAVCGGDEVEAVTGEHAMTYSDIW